MNSCILDAIKYMKQGKYKLAVETIEPLANDGDVNAIRTLANFHQYSIPANPKKTFYWLCQLPFTPGSGDAFRLTRIFYCQKEAKRCLQQNEKTYNSLISSQSYQRLKNSIDNWRESSINSTEKVTLDWKNLDKTKALEIYNNWDNLF